MTSTRFSLISLALLAACSGNGNNPPDKSNTTTVLPPCTNCTPTGDRTFALPSPASAALWTTTPMDKVLREAVPPTTPGQKLQISAAKNEFEPLVFVVHPKANATVSISLSDFNGPGTIGASEIRRVGYVQIPEPSDASSIKTNLMPDPLHPMAFGQSLNLEGGMNHPFWITVHVPADAPAGDYTASLKINIDGVDSEIPVGLHVFNFALPAEIGFDGNWNSSFQALGGSESLEKVKQLKQFFYDHRLVPSSVAWPAGLNYTGGINYDCATSTFTEENNPYDFSQLGPEYIDGTGWNGTGFPSFEIMQFVNNSTPRPQDFCGVDRGPDHFGTAAYNAEWQKLLSALNSYLKAHNWTGKGYYYVQNEPQGQEDYDIAAFLAKLSKEAAPDMRIAISEEPKPEIAEHPMAGGASYDLWWADLSHFEPNYAKTRQSLGEEVWWYFLYGDLPPHFNPITIDHAGIESRIAFWAAWKYRIRGFAYYSVTGWGNDPYSNPKPQGTNQNGDGFLLYPPESGELVSSIRWELLREGVEDFEYLKLAAGGQIPLTPDQQAGCDSSAASAVSSTTSYTRDSSALMHLRDELGAFLEGKVNGCPVLSSKPEGAHPKAAYYINFQDPAGQPAADPLNIEGHTWLKIGWDAYDPKKGFGWSGPYIGDAAIMKYQYLDGAPVNELQKSIIFNDYGRTDTFVWDIENGKYDVTVSIGWQDKDYLKNRVVVEGTVLFDNAATTVSEPYKTATITVDVSDGNVTMEAGQQDEYTMLNWMSIVPTP